MTDANYHQQSGGVHNSAVAKSEDKSRFWTATALALSAIVNVICLWTISDHAKEHRLQQYDLDWFKSSEYAPLKARVEMQDKIINMLIVRKECLKP